MQQQMQQEISRAGNSKARSDGRKQQKTEPREGGCGKAIEGAGAFERVADSMPRPYRERA